MPFVGGGKGVPYKRPVHKKVSIFFEKICNMLPVLKSQGRKRK